LQVIRRKIAKKLQVFEGLVQLIFLKLEISYLFVDLTASHQTKGMIGFIFKDFVKGFEGAFLIA
jgi:hypothetical protein